MNSIQKIIAAADKLAESVEKEIILRNFYFKSFDKLDLEKLKIQQSITSENIKQYRKISKHAE
jgi:hypothetical protein